jgi:hypothetical protein
MFHGSTIRSVGRLLGGVLALSMGCGDVEDVEISDPATYHQREGFVQMVPPVHLPSSSNDVDQVRVWIRVPDGGSISARKDESGRILLRFPPGTIADRVEFAGEGDGSFVADVRGATILEDGGQKHHTYRPVARRPGAELIGVRWRAGDEPIHHKATDRLIERIRGTSPANTLAPDRLEELLTSVRKKNECLPCHDAARPDNQRPNQHGLVNRGTDDSGFFTPSTILAEAIPLEQYGQFDRSLSDAALVIQCGGQPVDPATLQHRRCPDGTVAFGVWDAKRAQQLDSGRFEAICESRRYLYERLDEAGKALVVDILRPCLDP